MWRVGKRGREGWVCTGVDAVVAGAGALEEFLPNVLAADPVLQDHAVVRRLRLDPPLPSARLFAAGSAGQGGGEGGARRECCSTNRPRRWCCRRRASPPGAPPSSRRCRTSAASRCASPAPRPSHGGQRAGSQRRGRAARGRERGAHDAAVHAAAVLADEDPDVVRGPGRVPVVAVGALLVPAVRIDQRAQLRVEARAVEQHRRRRALAHDARRGSARCRAQRRRPRVHQR